MTKQQMYLSDLLNRFDQICEKYSLPYYLVGHQLFYAVRRKGIHGYEADVAMYLSDWKVLAQALEDSTEYEMETPLDGGTFPGAYYRFVDKGTLMFDLNEYGTYAKPGMGINIHIIRKRCTAAASLARMENRLYKSIYETDFVPAVNPDLQIFRNGKEAYYRELTDLLEKAAASKNDGGCILHEPGSRNVPVFRKMLGEPEQVTLSALDLPAFFRKGLYLRLRYRRLRGDLKAVPYRMESYRCVISEELPYQIYMDQIKGLDLDIADLKQIGRVYTQKYQKIKVLNQGRTEGWDKTMFAAGERYRLWKKYMPMKEEILSCFRRGRYDEAELMLSDYIRVLNAYIKMEVVICFDADLFRIVVDLYRMNGFEEKADLMERVVLAEDLKPIEVTW